MMQELEIFKWNKTPVTHRGIREWPVNREEAFRSACTCEKQEHGRFAEGEDMLRTLIATYNICYTGNNTIFPQEIKCRYIRKRVKKQYNFE
jgi:hypothetical protein